jgi:hypothetical protein
MKAIGDLRKVWRVLRVTALLTFAVSLSQRSAAIVPMEEGGELSLDGVWEMGIERHYQDQVLVPGLAQAPGEMSPGTLWYRRRVELPPGDWTQATLWLKGARFAPQVYIDGQKVSASAGGMAPSEHKLRGTNVAPGRTILLEIALQSLRDLDPRDASCVPAADRWRSDNSSSLWDGVVLHFSGESQIVQLIPWTDFAADRLALHWQIAGGDATKRTIQALVLNPAGEVVASSGIANARQNQGVTRLTLKQGCKPWTPDSPNLYRVRLVLREGERRMDSRELTWGLRDFRCRDRRFVLNGEPIQLRGGTVVWHRWLRDPEAKTIAFDSSWFEQNIVCRLKSLGANTLRFHLGLPPERFLDLCDRDGLLVQLEWPFFHGIEASPESMRAQWRAWLDVAMRHPSVVLIHPWNEMEGKSLKEAWSALDSLLPQYPPLVISHRDVIHVHKYWWSLFENLGLYYDSAEQFDRPIMVDEFGGNYLDGRGDPGLYPSVRESLLRFLGREQTREERLEFQAEANAKVAEYWRRIGAAGFLPFCILGSPQDGNTWFLGDLAHPQPKPVWEALAAAFSPLSLSLEVWDRNFTPGQTVAVPLYFFNDTSKNQELTASVRLVRGEAADETIPAQLVSAAVAAHGTVKKTVQIHFPSEPGNWRLEAQLQGTVPGVIFPVTSSWRCRTLSVVVPSVLTSTTVGVPENESELREFLAQNGLRTVNPNDPRAQILLASKLTWAKLPQSRKLLRAMGEAVEEGRSVVLLDIGPRDLGQGYKRRSLGPLEGAPQVAAPRVEQYDLFSGIQVTLRETAEPESHLHPAADNDSLWAGLPRPSTWLWNGLRGGLVVPAADMEAVGLNAEALLSLWSSRGADQQAICHQGDYYAYELADFYEFSPRQKDTNTMTKLRDKVKFLAEDAPTLRERLNPNAPIETIDLSQSYRQSGKTGRALRLTALANCGKNLTRVPIVELAFGEGKGKVLLSQALTAGRLARGHHEPGLYGIRYDPVAEQFTLNMLAEVLKLEKQSHSESARIR